MALKGPKRQLPRGLLCIPVIIALTMVPFVTDAQGTPDLSAFVIEAVRTSAPPQIEPAIDQVGWHGAAHVRLTWNVDFRRPANEPTDVYLLTDGKYLYAAFVARQKAAALITQRTSGPAVNNDDWVAVFLWPSGINGFRYMFKCNAIGVCDQTSSENNDFAPNWKAAGHVVAGGFIVTMRIPLDVLRGDKRDQWRVQFARQVNRTGDATPVWAHAPGMEAEDQAEFSGYLSGMRNLGSSFRSQPRLAIYGLGAIAARAIGGNTSRVGADFAIPVTPTASIIGTVHPDYSNVELDQQTISPTEFRRQFQEVRPFFTQGASFYNKFSVINDSDNSNIMLYTPGIPTPADGLAVEGNQGNFGFAAFDATSPARTDAAETASWSSANNVYSAAFQRVTVNFPGFADRATAATVRIDNQRTAYAYADFGTDAGTNVLDPTQANWEEIGAVHHGPTSFLGAALRKIGAYYNPADGFVAHADIAGWAANAEQDVLPHAGPIVTVALQSAIDRYHDAKGNLNQADESLMLSVKTRDQFSFSISSGSSFLLSNAGVGGLFNQNGMTVSYRSDSATPTSLSYTVGRFGSGYLRSWSRLVSFQAGNRGSISLEVDDTDLATDEGRRQQQWLERAAYAYQIGPQASLAVGVRRIIGVEPPVFSTPAYVQAANVSLALHKRNGRDDWYIVYGDANALNTPPQLLMKWIHYFGAEKGT